MMAIAHRALCICLVVIGLSTGTVRGQECVTCRSERCPAKKHVHPWCGGKGADPLAKRERPADLKRPGPEPRWQPPEQGANQATPAQGPAREMTDHAGQQRQIGLPVIKPPAATIQALDTSSPRLTSRSHRPPPLLIAGWTLFGVGAAAVTAGAALWGLDGARRCDEQMCERFHGQDGGTALTAIGLTALGTSVVLMGLGYRRTLIGRTPHRSR